jgi:hypothetical protein
LIRKHDQGENALYSGQRLLSQILFFEATCFLISTKLIIKGFFANGTWNKVQDPKNKIIQLWNWY